MTWSRSGGPVARVIDRLRRVVTRVRMEPEDVHEVMDLLRAAGLAAWIAGGWGADALVGRRTRPHSDLDVVVAEEDEGRASEVLAAAGFRLVSRSEVPNTWLRLRVVLEDAAGRTIDLHPVDLAAAPAPFDPAAVGTVGGRPVPCLPRDLQLRLHQGYAHRRRDGRDVDLLRQVADSPR